eukprot:CAMPEP_0197655024 /NCGR_PEP_ID=MMETSP1338-20131121/39202_1 /TAXON_ID=43686 ORGANISM="Pelagodinium beii, Strain RCC1491" /NCGR_SAMPLE_ID=MMETSP1338 /ASSEMBLY_ACC=CAM_ASM_000754 /LENGTH=377 /DNA_ID=CAMNT_0043230587 /DNA_START=8 /DNA_END=1141 /DNA_ORIENTATION=-
MSMLSELPLPKEKYGIGISWDLSDEVIDIDLQAVVVDNKGSIIDAVYYNNLKALKAITHSGDERSGEQEGLDEVIWVSPGRLPEQVKMIIFVVAAYSGGHLKDARNGMLHVLEQKKELEMARFPLEQSSFNVDAVATMVRGSEGWSLRIIDEPAVDGNHFMDILEPTLGNLVRQVIPSAGRQKVAFAMEKGSVVCLPRSNLLGQVNAGLGWDVSPEVGEVDLDVSAVFFSKEGRMLGAVFFGNTEDFGCVHSGDNLTGEGEGDDEVISADFSLIPDSVQQIFFVVNIYSNGVTFEKVSNAYCRLLDSSGVELARYALQEGRGERGLVIARMMREPGARWGFQALGQFCKGRTWKDSVPELQSLALHQQMPAGSMGGA